MRKVFMVGWDGATFDLIQPWVEQGKLPTIAKLMKNGVHGDLQSTMPPWTFPAWTSFMTGTNPGKHGIFDFFRPRPDSYELEFVNGGHRQAPTFWKLLSDAGRRVVSISLPCTFPPEKINGAMISGFDFPGEGPGSNVDARGMHPPSLYDELKQHVGQHPIDASIMREVNRGEYDVVLERILDTIRQKAKTAKYLMEQEWDCFMILFGESDGSAHQFWKFTDPNSPLFVDHPAGLRDSILHVYQELDRQLADFLTRIPEDTILMMMSDHGFGGVSDWVLYPNLWLQGQGYISQRSSQHKGSNRLLDSLKHWAVERLPAGTQRMIFRHAPWLVGRVETKLRFGSIDWNATSAYFDETPYFPMLRINLQGRQPHGVVKPADYESVRDDLIDALESWTHPETGDRIVDAALRREEVYDGPCVELAPDIIPKWSLHQGYSFAFRNSSNATGSEWIEQVNPETAEYRQFFAGKSGTHRENGIFLAHGPNLCSGERIQNARIIDLAPTILSLMDVPIPTNMDGRVLEELFTSAHSPTPEFDNSDVSIPRETFSYASEDEEAVNDRLRALGYVE